MMFLVKLAETKSKLITYIFNNKKIIPTSQLFALYAINKISTTANKKI